MYFLVPFYEKKKKEFISLRERVKYFVTVSDHMIIYAGHLTVKIAFLYNTYVPMNA